MEAQTNPAAAEQPAPAAVVKPLAPLAATERIEALDVVRGFALAGIFLMNIEFFNRVLGTNGQGMPAGLTGLDWLASFFVAYFVQGKFWTIFSLLFGMGFAVMLSRAERAGRGFIAPYLRRILALAVFGAAHYIFIWGGDILFSYAVAAGALMIVLYGKWKPIVLALVVLSVIGVLLNAVFAVVVGLLFVSLVAVYMRSERRVSLFGRGMPLLSFILLLLGLIGALATVALWLMPNAPREARGPTATFSIIFIILALLSAKYRNPPELRPLRVGVTLYMFMAVSMTIGGAAQYLSPAEPVSPPVTAAAADVAATPSAPQAKPGAAAAARADDKAEARADGKAGGKPAAKEARKPDKTEAEKAAEKKAERAKRLQERADKNREEERISTKGSYLEAVEFRAREFPQKAAGDAAFAVVLIGMFLIGVWFVRSRVMENTGAHLPLFRKMALLLLPLGVGLGLIGAAIATTHVPGNDKDGFAFAQGLATLGSLPACLGYVGLVVLMLHSHSPFAKIRVLAPAGRMALTNYLMQSLLSTLIFYGYGLGFWGISRSAQLLYVAVFFALQVAFSHWWLARYRYGPLEWVWRAFTYRSLPAMRIAPVMGNAPLAAH